MTQCSRARKCSQRPFDTPVNHTDDTPYKEMFRFTASEIQNMGLTSRMENHSLNLRWRVVYLFVRGFRMLLDFFVWDVKKVRNIYRNRHAVAGRRLFVHLFSGFMHQSIPAASIPPPPRPRANPRALALFSSWMT